MEAPDPWFLGALDGAPLKTGHPALVRHLAPSHEERQKQEYRPEKGEAYALAVGRAVVVGHRPHPRCHTHRENRHVSSEKPSLVVSSPTPHEGQ